MLGLIKRNFQDKSKDTVMPLYKSLVRPHIEYCSYNQSPHLSKYINLIEGVQRRATKLTKDIKHLSYDERLENLRLSRLNTRRVRSDLIQTFKIINGIDKVDRPKSLFFEIGSGGRRGHSSKLFKKRSRLDSFFTVRQPNHSSFTSIKHLHEISTESPPTRALNTGGVYKFRDFLPISRYISQTTHDSAIVTI